MKISDFNPEYMASIYWQFWVRKRSKETKVKLRLYWREFPDHRTLAQVA